MENTDKPKKKIPLFPKFKTNITIQKYKGNSMFSDSSNSNILEDSSDQDTYEDNNYLCCSNKDVLKTQNLMSEEIDKIDISRANNSLYITPKKIKDDFREIEEFLAKNTYYKKNSCKINENKNKEKSPEKKNNKKEKDKDKDKDKDNIKIINDFFINNEGDIELSETNIKDPKNKQKINKTNTNTNMTNFLGPLLEEDINSGSILINKNKSIFSSLKDLWKFQKILLENHIIDNKSKIYILIIYIYSVKRNLFIFI